MIKNNLHITKVNKREKFWFHNIRSMNYFAYRYWWLLLLLFILYLILWYLFCFRVPYQQDCINDKNFNQTVESIKAKIDSCCDCRVEPTAPPVCPDRLLVFQVCNSNASKDDDFSVFLNGVNIGNLDLNTNDQVGSIFIASTNTSAKIVRADFICPISKMQVYYFDPSLVKYGENIIEMKNVRKNRNSNRGTIEIRNYIKQGDNLFDPCRVQNIEFVGGDGSSFRKSFNYTKCCE